MLMLKLHHLRLEEIAETELPIAELEDVRTVAELTAIVIGWNTGLVRSRTSSGVRPLVGAKRRVGT